MKTTKQTFMSGRVILAIVAGVAGSILFISIMRNYMLATVIGAIIAMMVAGERPRTQFTLLGLITGGFAGLYLGSQAYWLTDLLPGLHLGANLIVSLLSGLIVTGLLCAVYGFLIGSILALYRKGQIPFS